MIPTLKNIARGALWLWRLVMKDPLSWPRLPDELAWFNRSLREYRALCARDLAAEAPEIKTSPVLFQRQTVAMPFDAHYVYQAAWAHRRIARLSPRLHVDVSSNIPFLATLSASVPVLFLEYHPPRLAVTNLRRLHADILRLPLAARSVASLSCLHVIEHIGLGRYGDPLNARGTERACQELARCVAPGGVLFLSTPVGRRRTEFNAHRVSDPLDLPKYLPDLTLVEFSIVTDQGDLIENVEPARYAGQTYACGLYWFRRPHDG